jgi:hypothetical protein
MAGGEQRWAELSARAQDLALPGSERRAVFKELHEAIAAVIRTSEAPTAANKLLDLGVMEWAWVNPYSDIVTYIALGDLQGHADVKDMLTTAFAPSELVLRCSTAGARTSTPSGDTAFTTVCMQQSSQRSQASPPKLRGAEASSQTMSWRDSRWLPKPPVPRGIALKQRKVRACAPILRCSSSATTR